MRSREIRLAARPSGTPTETDFELAEVEVADPADGELLIRNEIMSVDPYMRPRMNDVPSYVPPFQVGEPLSGGAVGRVAASRHPDFAEGDWVFSMLGWQEVARSDGNGVRKLDPDRAPPSTALGVLGMPGLTAYVGLTRIGEMKEGEAVLVSGAAGAVGSVAGQLARLMGAGKVVGTAGSAEKVAWLTDELGFDAAVNYKDGPVGKLLKPHAPFDVYFDNVGGDHLEAAMFHLNDHGRVAACGAIAQYNAESPVPGPRNMMMIVGKRLRLQGFIVSDHGDLAGEFHQRAGAWVADGSLKFRETVVDGLDHAVEAFLDLLGGGNTGKMLVRL